MGCGARNLKKYDVQLTDYDESEDAVSLLIGADIAGKITTGRVHQLSCGLTAIQTLLGWTLMGKLRDEQEDSSVAVTAISLYVQNADIKDLWSLDVLGIKDPINFKAQEEIEEEARDEFLKTVNINKEGRYEAHPIKRLILF